MKNWLVSAVTAGALAIALTLATRAASAAFTEGVQAYQAHRYSIAIAKFQQAARQNPNDQAAHYYMALCYQGMNQMSLAKEHYQWVAYYGNGSYKSNAATALQQLSKYSTSRAATETAPVPSSIAAAPTGPASGHGARLSGRLKIYEFYTDWCSVCKKFAPFWDTTASRYGSKADFVRLNAEADGQGLAQKYNVRAYPTLIWTDGSGKEFYRSHGFGSAEDFQQTIDEFLKDHAG